MKIVPIFMKTVLVTILCFFCAALAQATQPVVAIHDSELTRALETMPAASTTPQETGFEWWPTNWNYFVMPESVEEALRSDGTAFTVVGDSNILAGVLINADGSPKYPIVISLASEAISDDEIAQLTNYVAAGGFLFVGSSAFTRNTNGTTRGDFAFANALGVHMVYPGLTNWGINTSFSKGTANRLVSHIPDGVIEWYMPYSAEDIPYGVAPLNFINTNNLAWQVQAGDASAIADGDNYPSLLVKQFGKGQFIYYAAMQPLIGHGGNDSGMYAYGIFRNAIEWAFESAKLPIPKLSPWPYPYDAALEIRHDLEAIPGLINQCEASAQFEHTNGASGDYYFCTGELREDYSFTDQTNEIASLQRAASLYGATIGPHNGGLTNPYTPSLITDYWYWHWGPDEVLDVDVSSLGYTNGTAYATTSISNSFMDVEGWLSGFTNGDGRRHWVSPAFNSTREGSKEILEQLGVITAGEEKLTPFPHWTLSTGTSGKHYSFLSLPVSDWYVGSTIAQSLESGHTTETVHALVDFYYSWGALINLYSHSSSAGGASPQDALWANNVLEQEYVAYSLNTNLHPRLWPANAGIIYNWWLQRGTAVIVPGFTNNGIQSVATFSITGASDPGTAVEVVIPGPSYSSLQVFTNGVAAGLSSYRTNGQVVKILVGTSVTNAEVDYVLSPEAQNDFYSVAEGATLTVDAPGVLGNDTVDLGGSNLTAVLVSGPAYGTLSLSTNGGFSYTPATNFSGLDTFSYMANDGTVDSGVATVTITVTSASGVIFLDDFTRTNNPGTLLPWIVQDGAWLITGGVLQSTSAPSSYAHAYIDGNWTNYSVEGQFAFPAVAPVGGGGLGGLLDPTTGAHYAAWIYPDGSPWGSPDTLMLIKFQDWTTWSGVAMGEVGLSSVGTNWHTLKLTFQENQIGVYYDGNLMIDVADDGFDGSGAYVSGGICVEDYEDVSSYVMLVDNVVVTELGLLAVNDSYSVNENTILNVAAPGVLANDLTGGAGSLSAVLVTNITQGTLTLSTNGGFSYTPGFNFSGTDSFAYQASNGSTNSSIATVTITVIPQGEALFSDDFTRTNNPASLLPPWLEYNSNTWAIVGGELQSQSAPPEDYAYAYIATNWTDYSVEGQISFPDALSGGGGLGGRFDSATGAHYGAWIYPDGSPWLSPKSLKLIKFTDWTTWSGIPMAEVNLASVGTNWHTLKLAFKGDQIGVYYDGALMISTNDPVSPYASGGISVETYENSENYAMSVEDVVVNLLAMDDSYSLVENTSLSVPAPGVLNNDTGVYGTNLTAVLVTAPAHGTLNLTNNGGFIYVPATNYNGSDFFVYQANDDQTNLGTATVTIIVKPVLTVTANNATRAYGTTNPVLTVSYSGFVNGNNTNVLSGAPVLSVSATTNSPVGNYTITVGAGTLSATNYDLVFVNGTLTINPAGLTLTASNQAKVYGQTLNFAGTEFGVSGLVNTDMVSSATLSSAGTVATAPVNGSPYSIGITNAVGVGLTNYTISYVNGSLTVGAATLEVSANNATRAYGATNPVFTVSYNGFVNGDTTNVLSGAPVLTTSAVTNSPVGSYVITNVIGNLVATNYTVSLANGSLTVTGAVLMVTADNATRAYGATNPVFTVSYNGFVNGDDTNVLSGSPGLTTSAVTNSPVGSYVITNVIGNLVATNYTVSLANGSLTVTGAVLTATANNATRAYGATNPVFTVSYNGFVNGDTTNVLSGAPVLTTSAVTNSPVGSYVITNVIGNLVATNYTVSLANGSLTVTGAVLTATANNATRAYGATNPVFTVSYNGFVNGDDTNVLSGSPGLTTSAVTNSPVGSYVITNVIGNLVATNYTVSLANGSLTVTGAVLTATANNATRAYGATNPVFTVSYNGFVNGDTTNVLSGSPALTTSAVTNSPVGSYVITNVIGNLVATNYTVSLANGSLTVTGAVLTATADNATRAYGATNPVFTVSYNGFVNGDTTNVLSGSPVLTTSAVTNSPVGSYVITNTIGTLVATNYTVSLANGSLTVTGAVLTATANNATRAYGATNPVFTVSYNGFVNGDTTNVLSGAPALTTSAVTNSPVGSYVITNAIGNLVATNYTVSLANGSLTVTGAVLTATANNATRAYGATNPVFTVSYNGFVNGDTTNVLSGAPVLATSAVTNSPVGSYVITNTIGNLVATNYTVSLANGSLTVTGAVLTATANNATRAYGATNPVFTVSYNGFVNGDDTNVLSGSPGLTTSAVTNSPVGSYVITNVIGTLVATNYTVSLANGSLTVTGAVLTATADNATRAYGATNPVFTVSYNGFVNGDTTNVLSGAPVLATSAVTNSPVGSYVITNVIGNLVATNYTVSLANGSLTVTGAVLTATANNATRAYGATNPVFTVSYNGFVNGDTTNVLSGAPVLTTSAVTNSPVGSYVITNVIGNLVVTNYTVSLANGSLTVTGAVLMVTANIGITANDKVYDGTMAATISSNNVVLNGVLGGDAVSLSTNGYTANFASAGVGNGIGVTVSGLTLTGASATNYTLAQPVELTANITAKALTITSVPTPVITSIGLTNGVVTLAWNSVASGIYRVQYIDNLNGTGWNDLLPDVTATGLTTTQTNVVGSTAQRFYRIKLFNPGITANNKVYDGTTTATINSNNVVLVGVVGGDTVNLSTNGYTANFVDANVGTGIVVTVSGLSLIGPSATNYTLAQPVDLTANITAAGVTVTGISANNKTYDGTTAATISSNNMILNGILVGDAANVWLSTNGYTANFVSTNAGTGIVVTVSGLTLSGSAATNYTLSQPVGLTANIGAATLTYAANPASMTYGSGVPALSGSVGGFVGTDTLGSATTGTLSFTTAATSSSGVGGYAVNGSGLTANNGNYTFVQALGNATALTINALAVNVTGARPYDGTAAVSAGILTVANKVGSDNVTVASGSGTLAGANIGSEAITSFGTLALGGASAGNYTLAGASGTVSITVSGLTVTNLLALNKNYDGTTNATLNATKAGLAGVLGGDSVTLVASNAVAYFADKNVGTNKPVTVTGLALGGAAAINYALVVPTNVTANITAKALTITSVPTPVITSIGLTNGVVTLAWNSAADGIYRVQYIDNLNGTGWNDLLPDVTATGLTTTQTNVVGSTAQRFYRIKLFNPGITANNKVYDGTTTATINSNNVMLVGVVGGDTVNLSTNGYTANFVNANVGTGIVVTVSGLSLIGPSAANYTLAQPVELTANIMPATLTVSAANMSRTYGLPNSLTVSYNGFVPGEGTNVLTGAPSLSTSATTNSPPGVYPITVGPGTLSAANYTFIFKGGTLTVVALPQLSGVALNGDQFVFNWPTVTGQTYQLQYKDNLAAATWILLGSPVVGTGSPIIVTNGLGASPQRFFRVVISP